MAFGTVDDTVLVAFALADEVEGDLQLFCESKGLDLNGLRFSLFWAALRCHTDAKCYLKKNSKIANVVLPYSCSQLTEKKREKQIVRSSGLLRSIRTLSKDSLYTVIAPVIES